jgi:hypothetical protein
MRKAPTIRLVNKLTAIVAHLRQLAQEGSQGHD